VLVACDQNFPAVLYSIDEKPCMAVMRVEGGGDDVRDWLCCLGPPG
jgi:hypothetical protein